MPKSADVCSCHAERSPYCSIHGLSGVRDRLKIPLGGPDVMNGPSLLGDVRRDPPDSTRVLMNVHPDTRDKLRRLLAEPEMAGMGYSAFINRAVEVAEKQLSARRVYLEG